MTQGGKQPAEKRTTLTEAGNRRDLQEGTKLTRRCSLLTEAPAHLGLHMHRKLKQVSVHLQTHIHTCVRAWHRPGTMWDTPGHMHTWLDR